MTHYYFYSEKQNQEQIVRGRRFIPCAVVDNREIEFTECLPPKAVNQYVKKYEDAICVIKTTLKPKIIYKAQN